MSLWTGILIGVVLTLVVSRVARRVLRSQMFGSGDIARRARRKALAETPHDRLLLLKEDLEAELARRKSP